MHSRWRTAPDGSIPLLAYVGAVGAPLEGGTRIAVLLGYAKNKEHAREVIAGAPAESIQFQLTTTEARDFGERLIEWADEAEAKVTKN